MRDDRDINEAGKTGREVKREERRLGINEKKYNKNKKKVRIK